MSGRGSMRGISQVQLKYFYFSNGQCSEYLVTGSESETGCLRPAPEYVPFGWRNLILVMVITINHKMMMCPLYFFASSLLFRSACVPGTDSGLSHCYDLR